MLEAAIPDIADKDFYDIIPENDDGEDLQAVTEDSYEVAPETCLPDLPLENIETYPQEDSHYLRPKKYIQKDKSTLSMLLGLGVKLPMVEFQCIRCYE